jgi:ubiquitin C-terminal hydrolase
MPPRGIPNLGNTCYASTCLQCLAASPSFVSALSARPAGGLAADLLSFLEDPSARATRTLYSRIGVSNDPSDVHEFMMHLVDRLDAESERKGCRQQQRPRAPSIRAFLDGAWKDLDDRRGPFERLFAGQLAQIKTCEACKDVSLSTDAFTCLNVGRGCIEDTLSWETVEDVACDACGRRAPARKAARLVRTPRVLVVLRDAATSRVPPWPVRLDLAHCLVKSAIRTCAYEAVSAACHLDGHYVALRRVGDDWFLANDLDVTRVPAVDLRSACAILYEKVGPL